MHYLIALISIALSSVSQVFFKKCVDSVVSQKADGTFEMIKLGMANMHLWYGMLCYLVSLFLWFYVLAYMELSKAFPLVSIGYIIVFVFSYFFLHEAITFYKIAGVTLIIAGVLFILK